MSIDPNELIHTQVTRPQIPVVDDGVGNYNLSPIGFPVANRSEDNNPTLFNPGFVVDRAVSTIISTNISPLSGLHGYNEGQKVTLTAQTITSENGDYIVHASVWDKFIEYKYDGTETDNKEGYYDEFDVDGNPLNHFRKGYSHREVAEFIKNKLSTSLNFGRVSSSRGNGSLYKWFFDGDDKVNIGGTNPSQSVFIDSFGSIRGYKKERTTANGPITADKLDFTKKLNIRERKLARWSLSNHHTEAMQGRNKSPFVRDYPFNYNSATTGNIFDGGMPTSEVKFDEWRIGISGSTATTLRPFCDSALFYQRENGYHNNITLDMKKSSTYGRHHISILHHLDRSDTSPSNPDEIGSGTTYTEYRDDLLMAELDTVANIDIGGGVILYKDTVGGITKYYYRQRQKQSVTIEQYGVGTWSPTNLLWEDASGTLRIYVTATGYVTYNVTGETVAWMLNNLVNNNDMIPVPFNVPVDAVDRAEYLKELNVLFISNSLVDHTQSVHRSEKIRSKKTFVHLPTPVDLVDGQQIEVDVSLPMISDQDAFKFNTIGSLSGYMNYMTQPRVQVFSGVRKCYDYLTDSIKNKLKINSISRTGTVATITSNNHGIIGSSRIELYGCSDSGYDQSYVATVTGVNTLTITVPNTLAASASGYGYRLVKISEITISSFIVASGIATITTGVQHGIVDAEDILINLSGSDVFSGVHRAFVVDQYTISFSTSEADQTVSAGAYFIKSIEVAHATNFVHDAYLDLSSVSSITRIGSTATIAFTEPLTQTPGELVSISVSGCLQSEYNGDFTGTITTAGISYTVSGTPATPATGIIRVTAMMHSDDMGYGANRILSGESVEGLTERKNQYLYSPMPEVEFATEGNIYHQHKMSTSNIDSTDKRVLLANVYPTSTNTFAWRMDKDPQIKMLKWSILASTSANGSAAYQGYSANKTAYDKIAPYLGTSRMSLYDSPIAYEYDAIPEDAHEMTNFLMSRIRVLMQENVVPTQDEILTDAEAMTYGSMTYQARKGYLESISTFHSTRIGVKNSSTLEPSISDAFIGYDDNGLHSDDISVGSITSLIQFNTGDVPNVASLNDARWMSKAIYTPERVVNATGYTAYTVDDAYNGVDQNLKTYLETNFGDTDIASNSGDRYIPTQLNSPSDPQFDFGIGVNNAIYNFLVNRGVSEGVKTDFKLALHDWYSPIDNTPASGKYGVMRDIDMRFTMYNSSIESIIKFYGMNMIPFSKIFSTDSVNPVENIFPLMVDFSTIMADPSIRTTLINSVSSNPALLQYATHIAAGETTAVAYENTMIGINSTALEPSGVSLLVKDSVAEYFRNHISGYANNMPIRFYNSFRIGVHGDSGSVEGTDHEDKFIWINNLRNYASEYISTLPNATYGTYIDDNFYLVEEDLAETYVNDSNDARVTIPGRGKSATAKITITDWSELLDGGFASVTVNGVVFTATLSTNPALNEFTVVESDIDTATNLAKSINNSYSSGVENIVADNYSGLSNVITLTVSASIGSAANSYGLVFTPSSIGNTGIEIVGFSGGVNAEDHSLNTKISISGQQYLADSQFYSNAMRSSYIRMKMRFVFSAQCGRWLTMDYRQCPTSYLTPGVGNKAYAKKERSIVKTGRDGKLTSDYIFVTEDNYSTITNKDYIWVMNSCFNPDEAYKSLWCNAYSEMKPMELNRFCLPFFCEEFPYDSDGHLKSEDSRSGQEAIISGAITSSANQVYSFGDLKYPELIGFTSPITLTGEGDADVVAGLPHPWAFYCHMRPVSTALGYGKGEIPSPTSRIGGLPSDPSLHNMFDFPCRVNESSDPCYLIPWHEDMGSDWLMNGMVSIESAIQNDVNRAEKLDIDAIMENYDWETNSPIDPSQSIDEDRTDFLEIESDRPIS